MSKAKKKHDQDMFISELAESYEHVDEHPLKKQNKQPKAKAWYFQRHATLIAGGALGVGFLVLYFNDQLARDVNAMTRGSW